MFEQARELVREAPEEFANVVAELDEFYSESAVKTRSPRLAGLTGRRCLLARLNIARRDAIAPLPEDTLHARRFEFEQVDDRERRRAAARRFVVVMLLSGDFHADEVISREWGELASLAWESIPDGELGREYCLWPIRADDDWSDRGNPSPAVLGRLRMAIDLLRGNTARAGSGQPLGSGGSPSELGVEARRGAAKSKPGGYTAQELRDEADAAGAPVSAERFRQIRIAAGLKPSPRGASGPMRRFSNAEIRKLVDVAEHGVPCRDGLRTFRDGGLIASAWRQLIE